MTEKPTAPCEVWNAYNNDVGRTREGRATLHALGITAEKLRNWHGIPSKHRFIRIALGLEAVTEDLALPAAA